MKCKKCETKLEIDSTCQTLVFSSDPAANTVYYCPTCDENTKARNDEISKFSIMGSGFSWDLITENLNINAGCETNTESWHNINTTCEELCRIDSSVDNSGILLVISVSSFTGVKDVWSDLWKYKDVIFIGCVFDGCGNLPPNNKIINCIVR